MEGMAIVLRRPEDKWHEPDTTYHEKALGLIGVFAFIIIPLLTILFVGDAQLAMTNLSSIGNTEGNRPRFILWGCVCATFFSAAFKLLYSLLGRKHHAIWHLSRIACFSLVSAVLIPFIPDLYPLSAWMHNNCAYVASLLAVAAMTLFIVQIRRVDKPLFLTIMAAWLLNMAVYMALLYKTGISALVEIVFVVTVSILLYIISHRLTRLNRTNDRLSQ